VKRVGALALVAVALAMTSLVQGGGWNQNAHLALVQALSHGRASVDRSTIQTGDLAFHDGRYYSAKAPGVALLAVGPYIVLDRSGALDRIARASGVPRHDIDLWALAAIVCALAAAVTLFLVARLGDEVAPGHGIAAAVTLGLATLLLPFSTLLFDHVPSAALGFAGFAILWPRKTGLLAVFAAGVVAGLAVTVEYPLAICAVALGFYAIARGDVVRRGFAYAAGVVLGTCPLFLYDWLVFGSPLHLPYEDAVPIAGQLSNERGLFGIAWPSLDTAARLLFDHRGLIVITPIIVCGIAGLVPLFKRGRRHEAVLIGALAAAFIVYNAGYDVPFGGDSPGPRFLIPILPFLAVPLALSWALWPWVTAALAVPSAVYAVGATVTGPLQASGWSWLTTTSPWAHATTGELARFLPLVLVAVAFAALSTRLHRPTHKEALLAAVALVLWVAIASGAPRVID
jgi:hypothetical protein